MPDVSEHEVIAAIAAEGGMARLLGGRAVAIVCGDAMPAPFRRPSADIDLIARGKDRRALKAAFTALACAPEKEFNLLNGKERMIYYAGDTKIDVFIDVFRMCHTLQLAGRLDQHPVTLAPADLLLTKLQVVKLDRKDLTDLAALLIACDLDTAYLAKTLAGDWGLWRTATGTLNTLRAQAADLCRDPALATTLDARIAAVLATINAAPKTMAWKMRAVVGERTSWYELPEEPEIAH